jgi:hypothetical protein
LTYLSNATKTQLKTCFNFACHSGTFITQVGRGALYFIPEMYEVSLNTLWTGNEDFRF